MATLIQRGPRGPRPARSWAALPSARRLGRRCLSAFHRAGWAIGPSPFCRFCRVPQHSLGTAWGPSPGRSGRRIPQGYSPVLGNKPPEFLSQPLEADVVPLEPLEPGRCAVVVPTGERARFRGLSLPLVVEPVDDLVDLPASSLLRSGRLPRTPNQSSLFLPAAPRFPAPRCPARCGLQQTPGLSPHG